LNHDEIVAEIAKLTETTSNIQKQLTKPKTLLDRFKEYAGILSLLLGLLLSVFALRETLVTKPSEAIESDRNTLHNALIAIALVDGDYIKAQHDPTTPATAIGALSARRRILLNQAASLAAKKGVATDDDEAMLAGFYEWVGSYDAAIAHYTAAKKLANDNHMKEAYAEYKIATFNFMGFGNTSVADARARFAQAVQLMDNTDSTEARWEIAYIYQALSWCECSRGDRAMGESAKTKALAVVAKIASDPGVTSQSVDSFKTTLETSLNATLCKAGSAGP
jgi:tetratricopeptide (TPR) repeat protein